MLAQARKIIETGLATMGLTVANVKLRLKSLEAIVEKKIRFASRFILKKNQNMSQKQQEQYTVNIVVSRIEERKNIYTFFSISFLEFMYIIIYILSYLYFALDSTNITDYCMDNDMSSEDQSVQDGELTRLNELRESALQARNELEYNRNLIIIQLRALSGRAGHARFFRLYRQVTAQIEDLIRTESRINRQMRIRQRSINNNR